MRKKSISWIEFLITFGIFISVILFIINRYLDFSQLVYNQIYQFVQIQKVSSLALYLLVNESTNYQNILETFRKNYKGFLFRYEQYPFIIFLDRSYEKASCINCIKFYNYNAECYVFEQNSTYDITSRLSVILFSTKDITLQGAKYICYPYLNLSVAIFGSVRYYKYCDIELSGNSSVKICNVKKFIIIDKYRSFLDFYLGKRNISSIGPEFGGGVTTVIFFKNKEGYITLASLKVS